MNKTVLNIEVGPEDLEHAGIGLISHPIARALSRTTGARWRVWDNRIAQELVAPYRVVALPDDVRKQWGNGADLSELSPFTFQIDWENKEKYAA